MALPLLALPWAAFTAASGVGGPLSTVELAAMWLIGAALMSVGTLWAVRRRSGAIGLLIAATGFAWLVPLLRFSSSSLPWTVSLTASTLHLATLTHVAFALPQGRRPAPAERRIIAATYATATVWPLAIATVSRDPASLGYEGFPRNLALIEPDVRLWETLNAGQALVQALLAAGVLALVARRLRTTRRALGPASVVGVAAAALLALPALTAGLEARSVPWLQTPWDGLRWAAMGLLAAATAALAAGLLRVSMATSSVAGLVVDIDRSTSSDTLRGALIRTLGDPSLALALWDPDRGLFVDGDGEPVELPRPGSKRVSTILERRGRRVGALVHDVSLLDEPDLIEAAASAVRIALENDRLHDELRRQLEEVRASRARIVEAGDQERRRLERNLHDGAQQKLVSLSIALRLAERRAQDDAALRSALENATDLTRGALADMRALAHGLHPPVLREEGLAGALESLATTFPVPVEVLAAPGERLPEPVEIAAYFVASEALTNVAKYAQARSATVSAIRTNGRVVVEVADDGIGGADAASGSGLRGLADRLAAIDGRLHVESPRNGGTRVKAEIPCA